MSLPLVLLRLRTVREAAAVAAEGGGGATREGAVGFTPSPFVASAANEATFSSAKETLLVSGGGWLLLLLWSSIAAARMGSGAESELSLAREGGSGGRPPATAAAVAAAAAESCDSRSLLPPNADLSGAPFPGEDAAATTEKVGEAAAGFVAAAVVVVAAADDGRSSLPSLASPFSLTSSCRACVQSPTSLMTIIRKGSCGAEASVKGCHLRVDRWKFF